MTLTNSIMASLDLETAPWQMQSKSESESRRSLPRTDKEYLAMREMQCLGDAHTGCDKNRSSLLERESSVPTAHTNTPLKLVSPWTSNDGGDDMGTYENDLSESEMAQKILHDKMSALELKWAERSHKKRLISEDCFL